MKVLVWVVGILLVLAFFWGSLHMFVPPVNPKQEPPDKHVKTACWACHFVSESAKIQSQ
jgi:hypothetical protein